MKATNPKVDGFLRESKEWRAELEQLRSIVLAAGLTEEFKWGKPCYMYQGTNIAILAPMKESCALMFCQGALLKDAAGVLLKPGENSQSTRWIKFTAVDEIVQRKALIQSYIAESIAAEKAGLKVTFKKVSEFAVPEELTKKLKATPALKRAYDALTPGRQRGYLLFIGGAKQSKTREARIEKCVPLILKGKGLQDK